MHRLIQASAASIYLTSTLGLVLSVAVLIRGAASGYAHSDHTGLLAFFFALVLAAGGGHALLWNYITEDMSDDDAGNLMWANCPPWMRRAAWGVIGIGALLFFAQFALTIAGWLPKWGGPEEGFPPLMVGSFGLIWFTASGARTYSAMHQG